MEIYCRFTINRLSIPIIYLEQYYLECTRLHVPVNFAVALLIPTHPHLLFFGAGGTCQVLVERSKCWWPYQGLDGV